MAQMQETGGEPGHDVDAPIGEILHRVADDVKTIATGEVELARLELERSFKTAAAEAGAMTLGAFVALIGFGLLCVSVVDALEPLIEPLWLRLILMAVVYLVVGGAIAGAFARRLRRQVPPDMSRVADHAKRTVDTVRHHLTNP